MSKQSSTYTFVFALIVCAICSLALSAVSEGLRPKKELNEAIDVKKNILKSVQLEDGLPQKIESEKMLALFESKIEQVAVNANGEIIEGLNPVDIKEGQDAYPIYIYKEGEQVKAYSFPISGKGLWSTLYGYLALEPDAKTVRGLTFYKHGETPGLGAEIEKDWFQDNFQGKKIWDSKNQELMPVSVVKGKVETSIQDQYKQQFYVDGISGATMTAKGVTALIDNWVRVYEPFFKKIRMQGGA